MLIILDLLKRKVNWLTAFVVFWAIMLNILALHNLGACDFKDGFMAVVLGVTMAGLIATAGTMTYIISEYKEQ